MKRKLNIAGGNFLRKWQGEAPRGRSMASPDEHKGQAREDVINKFKRVYDPSQRAYVRRWEF